MNDNIVELECTDATEHLYNLIKEISTDMTNGKLYTFSGVSSVLLCLEENFIHELIKRTIDKFDKLFERYLIVLNEHRREIFKSISYFFRQLLLFQVTNVIYLKLIESDLSFLNEPELKVKFGIQDDEIKIVFSGTVKNNFALNWSVVDRIIKESLIFPLFIAELHNVENKAAMKLIPEIFSGVSNSNLVDSLFNDTQSRCQELKTTKTPSMKFLEKIHSTQNLLMGDGITPNQSRVATELKMKTTTFVDTRKKFKITYNKLTYEFAINP